MGKVETNEMEQQHEGNDADVQEFFSEFSALMARATTLGLDHISAGMEQMVEPSPDACVTASGTTVTLGSGGYADTLQLDDAQIFEISMNHRENMAHGLLHASAAMKIEVRAQKMGFSML